MGTITPSGSRTPPLGSGPDQEGLDLYNEFMKFFWDPTSPYYELCDALQSLCWGYTGAEIKTIMDQVLSEAYGTAPAQCDAYLQYNLQDTDLTNFVTDINGIMSKYHDSYTPPSSLSFTDADKVYMGLTEWAATTPYFYAVPLANAFLASFKENIGSCLQGPYDPKVADKLLTNILLDPNFFTNFPDINPTTYQDLQAFMGEMPAYPWPNFVDNYLEVGAWPASTGSEKLKDDLLSKMRALWIQTPPGTLADLQAWAVSEINGGFADYPQLDEIRATGLETILNLPPADIPPLQHQFFQIRTWMARLTPGTPEAIMANDLKTEIMKNLWPSKTPSDLQNWYTSTYGTQDPFMQYYKVDSADIQMFYQIADSTTGTIQATTTDTNYREVISYRDTFDPSTNDYKLMDALAGQWLQVGSNPTVGQMQTIANWMEGMKTDPRYTGATAVTQAKFLSYFNDPEGTSIYNALEALVAAAPAMNLLVQAMLKGIPGPPYDHSLLMAQINTVLSTTYGSGITHDAYMEFNVNGDMLQMFQTMLNNAVTPSGGSFNLPASLTYTPTDQDYGRIVNWLVNNPTITDIQGLANGLLNSIKTTLGSGGDETQVAELFQGMLTDPNFFTNYPEITVAAYNDLVTFAAQVGPSGYTLPDFMQNYLQAYYNWPNPNHNADDTKLQQYLLEGMRLIWASESLSEIQSSMYQLFITPAFFNYPNLDLSGAQNFENVLGFPLPGMPIPAVQSQFFEARTLLNKCTSGEAYTMANALMTEVSNLWASGTPADLQTWYTSTYGTQDPFMQYYNVDSDDVETFYQIANNTTVPLQPTTSDSNYRDALNYRDTFDPSTHDYNLMDAFGKEVYPYGSNPTDSQQQVMAQWAMGKLGSADFMNSMPATQQKFVTYFDYSVSLTYFKDFLLVWEQTQPSYNKNFATTLRSIISGYIQTHPNPTQADFQNYLNDNYSKADYCVQFPGVSSWDVSIIFANFGLKNPHVYTTIDNACMLFYKVEQTFPTPPVGSPDAIAISLFYKELQLAEVNYDPKNPNADLFKTYIKPWIADFEKSDLWNELQPGTRALFNGINALEPS